jgi:anaerobic magnesium-protoporphyrin IX monomethyl ester cyclase
MKNILMLNPPFLPESGKFSREQRSPAVTKSGTLYYPMWLAYATGVLEAKGYPVKLLDAPARGLSLDEIVPIVEKFKPALIVLDTSTPSIYNDVQVGESLKGKVPNTKIVLVGPHVSATAEETLSISNQIDMVARGEYDYTLPDIASRLEAGSEAWESIKGISYRQGDKIIHNPERDLIENLDALPFVAQVYKKHLNYKDYFYAHSCYPVVTIIGGRGCPFKCSYCVYPQVFSDTRVRYRSISNIVDEIEFILREFEGLQEIMFEDDTLTLDRERCKNLCREILARNIKIK